MLLTKSCKFHRVLSPRWDVQCHWLKGDLSYTVVTINALYLYHTVGHTVFLPRWDVPCYWIVTIIIYTIQCFHPGGLSNVTDLYSSCNHTVLPPRWDVQSWMCCHLEHARIQSASSTSLVPGPLSLLTWLLRSTATLTLTPCRPHSGLCASRWLRIHSAFWVFVFISFC